jgi:broad specificity phosphatase PhoE
MSTRIVHEPRVLLIRHGRTALNAAGVLRGHLDPPLDDLGRVQAAALAWALAYLRPAAIVCSPLQRALQTAGPLSRHTGVPVEIDPRLIDRDYGRWAGHSVAEVRRAGFDLDDTASGIESSAAVLRRARRVLEEQVSRLHVGPVVLVAHEVINRLLLTDIDARLGKPDAVPQRPGCWNLLVRVDSAWTVRLVDQRVDDQEPDD